MRQASAVGKRTCANDCDALRNRYVSTLSLINQEHSVTDYKVIRTVAAKDSGIGHFCLQHVTISRVAVFGNVSSFNRPICGSHRRRGFTRKGNGFQVCATRKNISCCRAKLFQVLTEYDMLQR